MDAMAAIRATFFQECEEQLSELESGLMALEGGNADPETVNAVFRAVHSVKGGAGAFGLDVLVRFAHVFETTLDDVRSKRLVAGPAALKLMLRAADVLADLVCAARDGTAVDEAGNASLAAELAALRSPDGTVGRPASEPADDGLDDLGFQPLAVVLDEPEPQKGAPWTIRLTPRAELYGQGNETALLLRELGRLGSMTVSIDQARLPELGELDAEGAYLSWIVTLDASCDEAAIREVFEFVEDECELAISREAEPSASGPGSTCTADQDILAMIQAISAATKVPDPVSPMPPRPPSVPAVAEHEAPAVGAPAESAAQRPDAMQAAPASIRVDLDRVDRLIDLVGELVINEAMLSQRVLEAGLPKASNAVMALDELGQLTREIQDSVMAIRAQPVRSVFQRMPRLVREVAAMTGKPVRLITDGEATEVDKTVIERLADPLTHMIRNAIDHGLEVPDVRRAAGKPAEGIVRLCALHRSGRIVIEVSDDGAGINRANVRAKALERGLITPDAQLSDDEVDNLIFLPGFSTASVVSDLSGRGVGMDVVKRSVQALGGRIAITSRPGEGSTFTLSLPLTLAVLDGMVVTVEGQTLIVPLGAIMETLQPRTTDVHGLGNEAKLISIRGGYVPLVDVGIALGYRARPLEPERGVALLVEGEGTRAVLLVDAIQGQRQVVIKSLEANYGSVPGIAAATVMGDGRVALILDIDVIACVRRAEPVAPAIALPALMLETL